MTVHPSAVRSVESPEERRERVLWDAEGVERRTELRREADRLRVLQAFLARSTEAEAA